MQEVNNMIEFSKMVMFSDVTTELEAVKQFIKTTDNIRMYQEKTIESDLTIKEIYLVIEEICKVISFIVPKEMNNTNKGMEIERINATYNIGRVLSMINTELSNYISMNDLWEEE